MDETFYASDPAAAPGTMPEAEAENIQPAREADATVDTPAQAENPAAEKNPEGAPDETEKSLQGASDKAEKAAPAFTIPVKYNKEYRELTPEEAAVYAQKGMKYDALEPALLRLRQIAGQSGRSLSQLLDSIFQAGETLTRQNLMQRTGGDQALVDELMEARRLKEDRARADAQARQQQAAESEKAESGNRLAGEFLELQAEFPEITGVDDLPDSVLEDAAVKGSSLTAAYLLFRHREAQRVARAEADGKTADSASAGSMQDFAGGSDTPALSAMVKAVWE